jgi:plasmid maintenance system killer protein
MEVHFKTPKMKKIFQDSKSLNRKYGDERGRRLQKLISWIRAALSLREFDSTPLKVLTDFHALQADRLGQYAMSVTGNYRLIFEALEPTSLLEYIKEIKILGVEDYHK